jgi:bacterioferritin-associated ferredoxin
MVVCSCRAVTDRAVRAAVEQGATSVEEITEQCNAASDCGGCWPELERLIASHAGDRSLTSASA